MGENRRHARRSSSDRLLRTPGRARGAVRRRDPLPRGAGARFQLSGTARAPSCRRRRASFAHERRPVRQLSRSRHRSAGRTKMPRPQDGVLYAYRAGPIDQPDNRALRQAHELGVPVVYFVATRPGAYEAVFPCFLRHRRSCRTRRPCSEGQDARRLRRARADGDRGPARASLRATVTFACVSISGASAGACCRPTATSAPSAG